MSSESVDMSHDLVHQEITDAHIEQGGHDSSWESDEWGSPRAYEEDYEDPVSYQKTNEWMNLVDIQSAQIEKIVQHLTASAHQDEGAIRLRPGLNQLGEELKNMINSQRKLKLELASKDSQIEAREEQFTTTNDHLHAELATHKEKLAQLAQIVQALPSVDITLQQAADIETLTHNNADLERLNSTLQTQLAEAQDATSTAVARANVVASSVEPAVKLLDPELLQAKEQALKENKLILSKNQDLLDKTNQLQSNLNDVKSQLSDAHERHAQEVARLNQEAITMNAALATAKLALNKERRITANLQIQDESDINQDQRHAVAMVTEVHNAEVADLTLRVAEREQQSQAQLRQIDELRLKLVHATNTTNQNKQKQELEKLRKEYKDLENENETLIQKMSSHSETGARQNEQMKEQLEMIGLSLFFLFLTHSLSLYIYIYIYI